MARLTYRSLLLSTVLSIAQVTSGSAALNQDAEEQRPEELERITGDAAEQEVIREADIGWIGEYFQGQIDRQIENNRLIRELQQRGDALSRYIGIPDIARGHEAVYQQFLRGKLVYKPNKGNDEGRQEFRISDLANPLSGTFDIRGCGDSDQHLSISTGFRTGKNDANSNKLEVWIVPQFVLQKDARAEPYNDFLQTLDGHRNKPFAILFTWGGWAADESSHNVTGVSGNESDSMLEVCSGVLFEGDYEWVMERGHILVSGGSWQVSLHQ